MRRGEERSPQGFFFFFFFSMCGLDWTLVLLLLGLLKASGCLKLQEENQDLLQSLCWRGEGSNWTAEAPDPGLSLLGDVLVVLVDTSRPPSAPAALPPDEATKVKPSFWQFSAVFSVAPCINSAARDPEM